MVHHPAPYSKLAPTKAYDTAPATAAIAPTLALATATAYDHNRLAHL